MDFDFSQEQEMLRETARRYFSDKLSIPRMREIAESKTGFDTNAWLEMAELGWMAIPVPVQFNGLGLGLVDLLVIAEEFGRTAQSGPLLSTLAIATLLSEQATVEQQSRWLTKIATGECVATWAHVDSGGWGPDEVALHTEPRGDTLYLSGKKKLVPYAGSADLLFVSVRHEHQVRVLVIPTDTPGIETDIHTTIDVFSKMCTVTFNNIACSRDNLLPHNSRHSVAERLHQIAIVLQGAESLGASERLLEMTIEYTGIRHQFNRPIGQLPGASSSLCRYANSYGTDDGGHTLCSTRRSQ